MKKVLCVFLAAVFFCSVLVQPAVNAVDYYRMEEIYDWYFGSDEEEAAEESGKKTAVSAEKENDADISTETRSDPIYTKNIVRRNIRTTNLTADGAKSVSAEANGFTLSLDTSNYTATITGVTDTAVVTFEIPDVITVDGTDYTVTSIGDGAFNSCKQLQKVYFNVENCSCSYWTAIFKNSTLKEIEFGENVTKIPAYVCSGCQSLTSVKFNGTVTTIGSNAFYGTSIVSVDLSNVTAIGSNAFENCTVLANPEFSDVLETIDDNAYKNTNIT
ncbi:MAG: leucine-rich repeat protein, partial [Clostridia bacterium]|nr:leucine-rich repeat protein [Clostridia bacterium]